MDRALRALYELAINPFADQLSRPPNVATAPAELGSFESCEVCFDPGYDPLEPPLPDQPGDGISLA